MNNHKPLCWRYNGSNRLECFIHIGGINTRRRCNFYSRHSADIFRPAVQLEAKMRARIYGKKNAELSMAQSEYH